MQHNPAANDQPKYINGWDKHTYLCLYRWRVGLNTCGPLWFQVYLRGVHFSSTKTKINFFRREFIRNVRLHTTSIHPCISRSAFCGNSIFSFGFILSGCVASVRGSIAQLNKFMIRNDNKQLSTWQRVKTIIIFITLHLSKHTPSTHQPPPPTIYWRQPKRQNVLVTAARTQYRTRHEMMKNLHVFRSTHRTHTHECPVARSVRYIRNDADAIPHPHSTYSITFYGVQFIVSRVV